MESKIGRIDTPSGTTIHLTAPDGIVNVNSFISLAVFISLTRNPSDPSNRLIEDDTTACLPGPSVDLVSFHVYSFSSFLFSSLIATASGRHPDHPQPVLPPAGRDSSPGQQQLLPPDRDARLESRFGCQVRVRDAGSHQRGADQLGTLACCSSHTLAAVVPLVIFVPVALHIYVCTVLVGRLSAEEY